MINPVIEAISAALHEEFGEEYEIHMEEVRQGLEEPCFFIFCLEASQEKFRGKRYWCRNPYCIRFIPGTEEKQRECNATRGRLYRCLEYIKICGEEKPIRGTEMSGVIEDGILNFMVSYNYFVYRQEESPAMEIMEAATDVRKGDRNVTE